MTSTNTSSNISVAQQFQVEALVPRTEIWSKDPERQSPSVPGLLNNSN